MSHKNLNMNVHNSTIHNNVETIVYLCCGILSSHTKVSFLLFFHKYTTYLLFSGEI